MEGAADTQLPQDLLFQSGKERKGDVTSEGKETETFEPAQLAQETAGCFLDIDTSAFSI